MENQDKIPSQQINPVPKKLSVIGSYILASIFMAVGLFMLMIGFLIKDSVLMLAWTLSFGFLFIGGVIMLVIGARRVNKAIRIKANYNQFQSGTIVDFKQQFSKVNILDNEKSLGWIGPVSRNKAVWFPLWLGKEKVPYPENTIIFTNKQLIGITIGDEDMVNLPESGELKKITSSLINISPGDYFTKSLQVTALHNKDWSKIMQNVFAMPLYELVSSHYSFGLTYDLISHVEINSGFTNSPLKVILKNNDVLKYTVMNDEEISKMREMVTQLNQYVPISYR